MARYLWPILTVFVILSIGAPCVTFYILIKDYWAELSHLRQQLLICRFSFAESPLEGALEMWTKLPQDTLPPTSRGAKESLLTPPFNSISSHPSFNTHLFNSDSAKSPPDNSRGFRYSRATTEHPSDGDFSSSKMTDVPPPPQNSPSQFFGARVAHTNSLDRMGKPSLRKTLRRVTRTTPSLPTFPTHLLDVKRRMVSDQGQTLNTQGTYDIKYVSGLEKRVLDLTSRVESCRKCLTRSNRKEGRCGGSGWKEFRRKEKELRKKIRQEKRRRRKQDSEKESLKILNLEKAFETQEPSSAETQHDLFTDFVSIPGWRRGEGPGMSAHTMRQNHRASTDFRRGFNQKISRMDEALMQFSETQAAFCKELRDNLGGRLKKRGMELAALSNQITSLVRTTTMQVAMLEELMTDQVFAGQQSIEKNLAKTQALQDHQIRTIKTFQKNTFSPAMINLATLLGELASGITNMGVELITKIEVLQDLHLTFSTQQSDVLLKLTESVDMFASKQGNLLMRSQDHARRIHMNAEKFIHELQNRMNNVVKELVLIRLQSQNFVSLSKDTYIDISSSLNQTHEAMSDLSYDLNNKMNTAKETHSEFKKMFTQETEIINNRIQSGISEVLLLNHNAVNQIGESELETKVFSDQAQSAWKELYLNQETELRLDADMLANNLRSHNHHTQNILTGLQGTAETHEQVLEEQRADFQSFVRKRQDALDTQCASISDWALLMSSELRRRDGDIHRFLSEEIRYSPAASDHQLG